jgi:hypothetical protein
MTLLAPWLMLGAALLALPIAIHILNKSRFDVETWGAMMFLQQSLRVRAQKLKVQQLILLILRSAFFIFFALALARPISKPENFGKEEQPTTHVLVIDGSYSTRQGKGKEQSFTRLKEQAEHLINKMADHDDMLIVWAGVKPRPLFEKPIFDKDVLKRHVADLEPGDEYMDLSRALEKTFWLLEQSHQPRHRIYLLTDGQAQSWRDPENHQWEQLKENYGLLKVKPTVYAFAQAPEDPQKNLSINKVYSRAPVIDTFRQTTFLVEVLNHSKVERNAKVTFYLNDRLMAEKSVPVKPGSNTVDFTCRIDEPGSNYLRVALGPDDISVDNHYILALHVMKQIPVLLLEGKSSGNPAESDGLVMSAALDAAARPGEANLLKVTRRNYLDAQEIDLDYLRQYKCVVLTNVPSLNRVLQDLLKHYVRKGGGLFICLGPDVSPDVYNEMYDEGEGLLPGQLQERVEKEDGDDFFYPVFPAGTAGEVLTVFDLKRTRELKEVMVGEYWKVTPAEDALTVARLGNDPFILKRKVEEGNVVLWTTTGNLEWTNFPVTPDFLPLTQDIVLFLSAGVEPPVNLAQGETLLYSSERPITGDDDEGTVEEPKPEDGAGVASEERVVILKTPEGEEETVEMLYTGDEWVAQWNETLRPGLYTVINENDADTRYFAVNINGQEGALEEVSGDDRAEVSDRIPVSFVDTREDLDKLVAEEIGVREWWQMFIFMCIILLSVELVLGWRFNA